MRILLWAAALCALSTIAITAFIGWLVATTSGGDWLLQQALRRIPGTVEASLVDGRLIDGFTVQGIRYDAGRPDAPRLALERLQIDWRPAELLRHRVGLDRILATGLVVDLASSDEPIVLTDLHLPIPVRLESLALDDTRVRIDDEPLPTIENLSLSATADGDTVEVRRLTLATAQATVAGSGTVTTSGSYALDFEVDWTLAVNDDLTLAGSGTIGGDLEAVRLEQRLETPAEIRLRGRILTPLDVPAFAFTAQLKDLDPRAFDTALPDLRLSGEVEFDGVPDDYRLTVGIDLAGSQPARAPQGASDWTQGGWVEGRWLADGHGDRSRFKLDRLQVRLAGGEIRASGELSWNPEPTWDLAVTAGAVDPSVLFPEWPGRIDLAARTTGHFMADAPSFSVAVTKLAGQLRGYPIDGDLQLEVAPGEIAVDRLELTSKQTHFEISGRMDETWDLTWRIQAGDLASIHPRVRGQLQAQGSILGPRSTPHTRFHLEAGDLVLDDLAVERLTAGADIDLGPDGPFQLTLAAQGLSHQALTLDDFHVELNGTRDDHRLVLAIAGPIGNLQGRARGALVGDLEAIDTLAWEGVLERLDLSRGGIGDWRLRKATRISSTAGTATLDRACWQSTADESACVEGRWSKTEGWHADAALTDLPLSFFKPLLPAALELDGRLTAEGSAGIDAAGSVRAELTAAAEGTAALIEDETLGTMQPFTAHVSTARIDGAGTYAAADLAIAGSRIDLEVDIPGYSQLAIPPADQLIDGSLIGRVEDISALEPFLLGVRRLRGSVDLDSRLSGPISSPHMAGTASLQATMELPLLGIELTRFDLTATGDGSGRLDLSGDLETDDGSTLHLSGSTPTVSKAEAPTILHLEGDHFQAVHLPEAKVWISPDLEISVAPEDIRVTGVIDVPTAEIELVQQKRGAVTVSEDVVVVGGPVASTPVGTHTSADLRVTLGDAVAVRGDGLKATLGGSLRIRQSPRQPPTAEGTLLVRRGSYRGYNQDLRIENGKILFSGGRIDNPALDIAAFRRARDGVVAGVHLRGTLDAPLVSLYSTPPLPEAEILSYIMRGRRSSTGMSQDDMSEAAASLGLAQSTAMLNNLGLKNVSVESEGTIDEAALVLGTYLAPNFYVSYGVGLFESVNTFRMRYEFSDNWMVETDTSEEGSGADLSLTFEK